MIAVSGIGESFGYQTPFTLSVGFKLRVLLAQVLAADPDALLLDEPTNPSRHPLHPLAREVSSRATRAVSAGLADSPATI
jgi:ABC-type transporter Mla maintaining outer membrane lipid asymmetry ATPase subunit MlaF